MAFPNLSKLVSCVAFHKLLAARGKRNRGQSMVELTLTLPFIILLLFCFIEMSRVWQSWHGAKIAADDGCYTAAVNRDSALGQSTMHARALVSRLTFTTASVTEISNAAGTLPIGYECTITVMHQPILTGFSMPLPGAGPVSLFGAGIPITYSNDYFRSVF